MATGPGISRYLPEEAQVLLLAELVDESRFGEVAELLDSVSLRVPRDVGNRVFELIKRKLVLRSELEARDLSEDAELRTLAHVTCKMDVVGDEVELWMSSQLAAYVNEERDGSSARDFSGDSKGADGENVDRINVGVLLEFLELVYLFSSRGSGSGASKLDSALVTLLGCEDEDVALKSSKLMRWHINGVAERCASDMEFDRETWRLINLALLEGTTRPWKLRNCLSFLLRFFVVSDTTPGLREFIQTNEYWRHLQVALAQEVHEYRKLGLSVLQLTIKEISTWSDSFDTSLVSFDSLHIPKFVQSWKEFATLYEIVSLDIAMNQIEAASGGILKLLDSDAYLNPTWGLILFSTGLRAPMESVRKYMVPLLFQIRNKSVFARDLTNFRAIFLPSIMEAHFFTCDGTTCAYGDLLADFISAVINESREAASIVVESVLQTLVDQRESFDPARIYVSLGIINSLRKRNARLLTPDHVRLITKLFEFESEDGVFETTINTIYLKLLLHVSPSVTPTEWVHSIATHIKCNQNSYEYFSPMAGLFEDFALTYYEQDAGRLLLEEDPTCNLLAIILWKYEDVPVTHDLLIEIARSDENLETYTDKAVKYLAILLRGNEKIDYESADILVQYSGFNMSTWKSINLEPFYQSITQSFSIDKLKFFAAVYRKTFENNINAFELSWPHLKNLYNLLKKKISSGQQYTFKVKDEAYGAYFDLLSLCLKATPLKDIEVKEVIHLLENNFWNDNGNFRGNQKVAELCAYLLTTYVPTKESQDAWEYVNPIFDLLAAIWDSFSTERLVLKQRDLHLSTINSIFHPTILLFATYCSTEGKDLANKIHQYGQKILQQAFNRRGMLPILSHNIRVFTQLHGNSLQTNGADYWWLICTMIGTFTCTQTTVNIFQIKTVLAKLFDQKIGAFHADSKGLYERTYGIEESSARIDIILALLQSPASFKDSFISATIDRTNLLVAIKRTDGAEEIRRLFEWQLVLLCVKTQDRARLLDYATRFVFPSLLEEFSPIIRIYMEWVISLSLTENYGQQDAFDLQNKIFSLMDDHARPIVVVSAERIIYLVLKALSVKSSGRHYELLSEFACKLVPNATSSKPLVRHFSNSLMLEFWPSFQESLEGSTLRGVMKGLFDKAESTKMSGRFRSGDAHVWDIEADLNLVGIFGGVLKKTFDYDLPFISEKQFHQYLPSQDLFPIGRDESSQWLMKRNNNRGAADAAGAADAPNIEQTQLQTKSGAWETLMDIDNESPERNVKRSDLIVVSSLVDKPPNLGGICRLCDVLGVGLLTVQDIRVKNHPHFKNVAVTADRWMPMAEVPVQGIVEFMAEKKREGYVLIGLEQTDKSVKLDTKYKFPKKSLILLGTEAHGIPGDLLNQLDLCLEIQQFGVVRSMNIQTATAVIVHSYTIQHM